MKAKIYSVLLASMLILANGFVSVYSQAPPLITVGTATLSAGTYSVPVNVSGFTNVGNISMKLGYDPAKLVYTGVVINTGLLAGSPVVTPTTDQSGVFALSCIKSTAFILEAPTDVLFTISFSVQPDVMGATAPLTWSTLQGDCDLTPPSPGAFDPPITVDNLSTFFTGGSIDIPLGQLITGPALVCPGSEGNVYSTFPGMTDYLWTVSSGGSITSGQGTNSITVTWNTAGSETVSVSYTDPINGPLSYDYPVEVGVPTPTITGPVDPVTDMPAKLGNGITIATYSTEAGMTGYIWAVSAAGVITAGDGTETITVTWTDPPGMQSVSVNYTGPGGCTAPSPTVLIISYFPFAGPIDPTVVPQFVDPLPHFAAGLRIDAKSLSNLVVRTELVQQVGLSKGTPLATGTAGIAGAGLGNYAAYNISRDGGTTWGIPMWPAQTIETMQGNPLTVEYRNELYGVTYNDFNILTDQTLMKNGYDLTGNPATDPYTGDIPMVVHLHGGEIPSSADGGPMAWFTPGYAKLGPAFTHDAESTVNYPNAQEATTLWYHPHDDGLTRINVYTGLAGFYILRGPDEEAAQLPGWSGDDLVREITPAGANPTFNGSSAYLPEIEVAIQDRMFDVNGELYWPVDPPNPDIHPYWTPEFVGDIMTVNGKSWPYMSVAPRKYRFRLLDGCNARWLNLWLVDAADGVSPGPAFKVVGGDGGLLSSPVTLDPASAQTLLIGPGQRYDVVIDFSGVPAGSKFILKNDAGAPYPGGDPVVEGTTDRIMQFVVNGEMASAADPTQVGADNSQVPADLRSVNPMIQLTDFSGTLATGVDPVVKRQIILNEVSAVGGPASVQVNNSYFDAELAIAGDPYNFGAATEFMTEGTTELIQIANVSADAHPLHIHLLQWQLVSRQPLDGDGYLTEYANVWAGRGLAEFPEGLGYPGGAGPPNDYNTLNADNAIGGNPAFSPFLTMGPAVAAEPEEMGWKDNTTVMPGEVTTFVVRIAPTDRPVDASPEELLLPFDPSLGPGYVWHCHIIDHEDMSMMRPLFILPSPLRFPQISAQPASVTVCVGDAISFSVTATSATTIAYQWQVSENAGVTWTPLADDAVYTGTATATLHIIASVDLSGNLYQCLLTNVDGTTSSNAATLTVNICEVNGRLIYGNASRDPLSGFNVNIDGQTAVTDGTGTFSVTGISSGTHLVTVNDHGKAVGGINSTDAGLTNYWFTTPSIIPYTQFLAGDVNNDAFVTAADALRIQNYFVLNQAFDRVPWQFHDATGSGTTNPPAFTVSVDGATVNNFDILSLATGDFNASFNPNAPAKGEGSSSLKLMIEETMKAGSGMAFELPIRSSKDMEIGAISMILNVPTDKVEITGVSVSGSQVPVTFKATGSQLRIGWYSLKPVNVKAEEDLIILKLKALSSFTDGQTLEISLDENPLNEIASGRFDIISGAVLKTLRVDGTAKRIIEKTGNELNLVIVPNPVKGLAMLNYTLPSDGQVTIQIYNSIGSLVTTLVNESKTRGKYSMNTDFAALPRGIYLAKIILGGSTLDKSFTVRFVVDK